MNEVPRSQRNPVEAYPQDLLFFFRVILFLRGLCSLISARVRYVEGFVPYARRAIALSVPIENHAVRVVAPSLRPIGLVLHWDSSAVSLSNLSFLRSSLATSFILISHSEIDMCKIQWNCCSSVFTPRICLLELR